MKFFEELEIDKLRGYVIFLDIDGTITVDNQVAVAKKVLDKIADLKQKNEVYLCSNSRNRLRNEQIAQLTGLMYLNTDLKKPSKKILNLAEKSCSKKRLVIGDKFLTDGIFAKNIQAEFIKVKRIVSGSESLYIKFLYGIDDLFFKMIR